MEKVVSNEEIMKALFRLQRDMEFIKESLADVVLTREDIVAIEKAEDEFKTGKTISLKDLKKEISNEL